MLRMKFLTALACMTAAASAGSAERLNVKPGLWEIESAIQLRGMPLSKDMQARLTPQQLAKMRADLEAEAAKGPHRETSRECITEAELERPFTTDTKDCKQTFVKSTRNAQEIRLDCTGERKGGGLMKVNAPTPETMTAALEVKMGQGADLFTMNGTLKGRWLGADCGDEADDSDVAGDEGDEPADDNETTEEEE